MMTLSDVLTARADNARATAQVECGSLGVVTLEALNARELERLSRGGDADRAIFYAACRDLQRTGAELLRAGKVYQPDQVTALVSAEEASIAAQKVRELSGATQETSPAGARADAAVNEGSDRGEDGRVSGESEMSEVRPDDVQESPEVRQETVQDTEDDGQIRPDGVQQKVTEFNEFRQGFVQSAGVTEPVEAGDGQVSREFLTEELTENAKPDKPQVLWSKTAQTPQNVVQMDNLDSGLRNIEPMTEQKTTGGKKKKSNRAHEGKSERTEGLHESSSELTGGKQSGLHESESDFTETLHENKSDFRKNVHESESEFTKILHENESELAECIARELLNGLRRAAWVR